MEIKYNLCGYWDAKQIAQLEKYNLLFQLGHDCKVIDKNKYLEIKYLLNEWGLNPISYPEFSRKEILESEYSLVSGYSPDGGYPMPDNINYQVLTYNTQNWCMTCGIGLVQSSPFRLSKVPKLKRKVFGLNWVYDELFVEKKYYEEVFKPLGVGYREVMLYKGDIKIESIVQLNIPTIEQELNLDEYKYEVCPKCNTKKYLPMPLGFFPIQKNPLPHIYKTKEYFGSGAAAWKKIIISKELRNKLIADKNMLLQWFIPCEK